MLKQIFLDSPSKKFLSGEITVVLHLVDTNPHIETKAPLNGILPLFQNDYSNLEN